MWLSSVDLAGFRMCLCDWPMLLCVDMAGLTKVLKRAKDNIIVTIEAGDYAVLRLAYKAKGKCNVLSLFPY